MNETQKYAGAALLRQTPTRTALRTRRPLLLFHLAGQNYALPLDDVQEILPMAELARSPSMPEVLAGFLNLSGTAVPVIRLATLLRLPVLLPGLYTPLLLLRHGDPRPALLVDRVSRVVEMAPDALLPVREDHTFNGCVEAVFTLDGRVNLLLSVERLLLEKEQQCLAELQDREQARLRDLEGVRS